MKVGNYTPILSVEEGIPTVDYAETLLDGT